ncbi:hypothetical protein [Propionicimonas sp.]|uniref:hypothetical protein n=1 Tax=Propionicimonas sp. TaxID=1955623 RepID=UPI0039E5FF78
MTDQLPPTTPNGDPDRTGRSAPPTGWSPAPLSDGGRPSFGAATPPSQPSDRPLGGSSLPSVTIEEYAPPRSRLPLLVAVIAIVVAGLIWAGTSLRAPQASPSTGPSAGATPTATASAPGLPFVTPDQSVSGRWEILEHRWTDSGLEVEIRVYADQGPVTYSFMAFGNDDVQATASEPGSQNPRFSGRPIDTGGSETGWVFFPLQRGASTIMLYTASGNQVSALPVAG